MALKFNNCTHSKKIVFCVVDNHEKCGTLWSKTMSQNISDFLLHRIDLFGYDIFIDSDEDNLLHTVSQQDYSHAVVISSGMYTGLSDRLFSAIEEKCKEDFFIAGHILHRGEDSGYFKNSYYELHHQLYIIDLLQYKEIGMPTIGQETLQSHTQIEPLRSQEYLYDDPEVPIWIKPGTEEKEFRIQCHGWNIISTALNYNKKLIDIGENIRNNKKYFYYEYDHVMLRTLPEVYQNQLFVNNFFPSWNSDGYRKEFNFEGPVEQYVTVGIGLYWVTNLIKLGITESTRVVFTDINNNTLNFMKSLVEEWDGTDYHLFYEKHIPRLPDGFEGNLEGYVDYTKKEWEAFLENHPNWIEMWNTVKKLNFDYILIDYMSNYTLNWLHPNKKTFINLSDVFTHSPYTPTQSFKYRISCENRLINSLINKDPNMYVLMTSRAANGFYSKERVTSGLIKDFDLTDINETQEPPWHTDEWKSPRLLG